MQLTRQGIVRASGCALAVAVGLGLAPQGAYAAAGAPPAPGPEWGVNQARPVGPPGQDPTPADGSGTGAQTMTASPRTVAPLAAAAATPGWVLHGSGWGHGIGMSQYGALEMAKDGYTAKQILAHYYTGTTYDAVTDNQVLDINVLYHIDPSSTLSASTSALASGGGAFTVTMAGAAGTMSGVAGTALTFSMVSGKIRATCTSCTGVTSLTGTAATLQWDKVSGMNDKTLLKLGGTQYRDGTIRISPYGTTSWNVVNQVKLHDEYPSPAKEDGRCPFRTRSCMPKFPFVSILNPKFIFINTIN